MVDVGSEFSNLPLGLFAVLFRYYFYILRSTTLIVNGFDLSSGIPVGFLTG